jgi:hypothetical protein
MVIIEYNGQAIIAANNLATRKNKKLAIYGTCTNNSVKQLGQYKQH